MLELLNGPSPTNHPSARRFSRLFVATLAIVAVLLTIGQIFTQIRIQHQVDRIKVTRVAMLLCKQSQQIAKKALQLSNSTDKIHNTSNLAELKQLARSFEVNHTYILKSQFPNQAIAIQLSDSVQIRYDDLLPYLNAIQRSTAYLIQKATQNVIPKSDSDLALLLANETLFVERIDAIIQAFNRESISQFQRLQQVEGYLYIFTILVLLLIAWFFLRPTIREFQDAIAQLVEAENQTAMANRKLLLLNRTVKETRQQLFEATRQQYQQQMDEHKLQTVYLLAGQEEERKRLSRDLHDGIGQMLTAIKLQVASLETSLNGSARGIKNLDTLKVLITQTIQEARNVSNNLMPTVLSDFGLIPALKMLAGSHTDSNSIEVNFHTTLTGIRLDKNAEIGLYRIAQEAVSNAVRHANPTRINIDLFEKDNYLHLIITDDGKGFRIHQSHKEETRRPSQGINNMNERAILLNGKFKISSAPDKGTKVQVSIPFKPTQSGHEYNQTDAGR